MSFQSEFQAAGEVYASRLDKQREADRLDALKLDARKHSNGSAFAEAIEAALAQHDTHTDDTQEIR